MAKTLEGHVFANNRQDWAEAMCSRLNVHSERVDLSCRLGFVGLPVDSGNAG